jgi:predicted lipoprotein
VKKYLPTLVLLVLAVFIGYQSVYFRRLSEMKKEGASAFDAVAFAQALWTGPVAASADSAQVYIELMDAVSREGAAALDRHSNALAIGNYRYAMVRAEGVVKSFSQEEILMEVPHADSVIQLIVAMEYIYGNAIRDASRAVAVKDFPNTSDLNGIAEALNRIARTRVVPDFRKTLSIGDRIEVTGAVELHREHLNLSVMEIQPVRLKRKSS